jgi:hypothetical protein
MDQSAIVTFDYEVFLGRRTGTIENCVIKPTKLILEILRENNAKAIFFVDAAWLLFLKENFYGDFQIVESQLHEISKSGSSIELHLHPQWINAVKSGDEIVFSSFKHYSLHSLNNEEIHDLFKNSIDLLQNITGKKILCFRAGGWCIEPFNSIKDAFETFKLKYDFSVVPGLYLNEGEVYDYDFTRVPLLPFYKFRNSAIVPEEKGCFVEVPLSTYRNIPVYRILNKVLLMSKNDKIYGDGIGIKEKSKYMVFSQVLKFAKGMLTLDKISNLVFKYLLKTHFRLSPLLVIVSHPKAVSPESLKNLLYITKRYNTLNSGDLEKYLRN